MARDKGPLDGVVRYITEGGFADELRARLEAHVRPTCEEMGVAIESLNEVLAPEVYAMMFTCVVEDLMSRPGADGRNVTEAYLKRHGCKQGNTVKKQLGALRDSKAGFYIITEVDPGVTVTLRNLLTPEEVISPLAREISKALPVGVPMGARVLTVDGHTSLSAGVLPFEEHMADEGIAALGADDGDLAARITNFWLKKTLEEQRNPPAATDEDGDA
jgi:hypothetical protein